MGTLLCIGLYPYDLVQLLVIAREARARLGVEPRFLDLAPPTVSLEVRELLAPDGFDIIAAESLIATGAPRNRFDRFRQQRKATLNLMDDLLDEVRPTAILCGVNHPPGFFLDHAAKCGVPSVLVQLFHWGDRAFYRGLHADDRRHEDAALDLPRRVKRGLERRLQAHYGFAPYVAWDVRHATVAVQGPAMRRRLIGGGVRSANVVVTGNPALDDLYRLKGSLGAARRRVSSQLGLADGVRVVTQMRSHEARLVGADKRALDDGQATMIEALRTAAPDAHLVVKVHPKEGEDEKAFVRSLDSEILVVGEEVSTNELLAASDVVVGALSTTLLYSVLLDRATVSALLWPGLDYFRKSTTWSGVERVESPAALIEAVRRHLDDPDHQAHWRAERQAFAREEFVFDGGGTRRLVDLLDRLMRERSRSHAPVQL